MFQCMVLVEGEWHKMTQVNERHAPHFSWGPGTPIRYKTQAEAYHRIAGASSLLPDYRYRVDEVPAGYRVVPQSVGADHYAGMRPGRVWVPLSSPYLFSDEEKARDIADSFRALGWTVYVEEADD